jgi:hypothetical protein
LFSVFSTFKVELEVSLHSSPLLNCCLAQGGIDFIAIRLLNMSCTIGLFNSFASVRLMIVSLLSYIIPSSSSTPQKSIATALARRLAVVSTLLAQSQCFIALSSTQLAARNPYHNLQHVAHYS